METQWAHRGTYDFYSCTYHCKFYGVCNVNHELSNKRESLVGTRSTHDQERLWVQDYMDYANQASEYTYSNLSWATWAGAQVANITGHVGKGSKLHVLVSVHETT